MYFINMKKVISLYTILSISEAAIVASDKNTFSNTIRYNEPIRSNINFWNYWSMWANWSTTEKYMNYTCPFLVADYKNYAETINEFIDLYPTVTIETQGKAVSVSTFGDKGKGKFGTLHFDTNNFIKFNDVRLTNFVYIVNAYDSLPFSYVVNVKIGVGFKKMQSQLYIIPFVDGSLFSVGAYTRYLEYGLDVSSVTFNPK